jgi:glycerophosphoryl diester phosphodiesterase
MQGVGTTFTSKTGAMAAWLVATALATSIAIAEPSRTDAQLGPRPFYLVEQMKDGPLKTRLRQCTGPFRRSDFSIGHRGAPLQFPEHTKESYEAAARMGAGVLECDVTFTKDRELVCRHSQCDLHTSTNILAIPELAAKCSQPFAPADPATGRKASAKCCTSDLTLAEFKRLRGKMDGANTNARTVAEYMQGTESWRTDLYAGFGTVLSHAESIELFKRLGTKFTPELKASEVAMPFGGDYTQQKYAQQMIDAYKTAGVDPKDVFPQSFNLYDVRYWIEREPAFGAQALYLDGRYDDARFSHADSATWKPSMSELAAMGVKILAPPTWKLVTLNERNEIVPSDYAKAARAAGLELIAWTVERSGPLSSGGGWYYRTIAGATDRDGVVFELLDVLARQVGVRGVFSDWPATTTFYANCMGMVRR